MVGEWSKIREEWFGEWSKVSKENGQRSEENGWRMVTGQRRMVWRMVRGQRRIAGELSEVKVEWLGEWSKVLKENGQRSEENDWRMVRGQRRMVWRMVRCLEGEWLENGQRS
ncbi:uncharacterized [Tachysurus ichikawai]